MWHLIYGYNTSDEVIQEYWFNSKIEKRRNFLEGQNNITVYVCSRSSMNPVLAFLRCLVGYRRICKIKCRA